MYLQLFLYDDEFIFISLKERGLSNILKIRRKRLRG